MSDDLELDVTAYDDGSRLVAPEAEADDQAVEGALRPRTLDAFIGQQRVQGPARPRARGGAAPRPRRRPRAAVRPAGSRQDDAGDDHRGRARHAAARHERSGAAARRRPRRDAVEPGARRGAVPRRDPPDGPRRPRRCSTSRWRTSGSTSSSARARVPPPSRSSCRRSPWSGRPPGPGCCPARCATGSASPPTWTSTTPPTSSRSSRARAALLEVSLDARRRGRDRRAQPGHPAHRQPAAAPRARLRPGPGGRPCRPRRRPGGARRSTRSTQIGLDRLDRAVLDALLRRFGGGPVGLSHARGGRRRGVRDRRDGLRAVPGAGRVPRPHAARPGRDAGRVGPPRARGPCRGCRVDGGRAAVRRGRGVRRPLRDRLGWSSVTGSPVRTGGTLRGDRRAAAHPAARRGVLAAHPAPGAGAAERGQRGHAPARRRVRGS